MILVPPSHLDAAALLAFELDNRVFFESTINARPPGYYSLEGVQASISSAMADAMVDRGYQFLLKDDSGTILGRANLGAVKRAHFHSAVLGYRVGESACGKGCASEAVRQLLGIAFGKLRLARIEADCRIDNLASAHVLLRNGFVQFGHSRRSFEHGGEWYDRLHFECHADTHELPAM